MIGKRFRSLPFIFANDNYTLSKIAVRNPVHFANRVYMVKIAVYLTADNRQRVSFLYNINPVLTVRASNSLFICPLRRIASLRFFFIIALRQAVFRIFIFHSPVTTVPFLFYPSTDSCSTGKIFNSQKADARIEHFV